MSCALFSLYLTNMDSGASAKLLAEAKAVLKLNDRGKYTVPAGDLYPHQWLWDSCFIAIGLRHLNIERAQDELRSLLRGQWHNGMLPHMIFNSKAEDIKNRRKETPYLNPFAPDNVSTSGLTQPPMLAEAVVKIGEKMKSPERRSWYKEMLGPLISYHEWIYIDRDPHHEGLAILIHPYECGLDDTPPWISELRRHSMPQWIRLTERLHMDRVANFVRRDTRYVPPGQRMSNIEAMAYWAALRRIRRKAFNSEAVLARPLFAVQDLAFNCILVRANTQLREITKTVEHQLPKSLQENMARSEKALEQLWHEPNGQYYSRSFVSQKLIEESTVATFLPLYGGNLPNDRARVLVDLIRSKKKFATNWPVPSVPRDSPHFNPYRYWQGPTWININWLIIQGLKDYGFDKEAQVLTERSLELVAKSGMNEYFNPLNGDPAGAPNFSWTAALTIDLLNS